MEREPKKTAKLGKAPLLILAALALTACADLLGFEHGTAIEDDDGSAPTGGGTSGAGGAKSAGSGGADAAIDGNRSDTIGNRPDASIDNSTGGAAGSGGTSGGTGAAGGAGGSGGSTGGSGGSTGGSGGSTGGSAGKAGDSGGATDASIDVTKPDTGVGVPDVALDRGITCATDQKICSAVCVPKTDPATGCAQTGCTPCAFPQATAICSTAGQCAVGTCNTGYANCNTADPKDGCETDLSKAETCGSCTNKCAAAAPLCSSSNGMLQCVTGCTAPASTLCGSQCVDVQTNVNYCGNCTTKCTQPTAHGSGACRGAQCATDCTTGYSACGSECVDLNTDLAHCGGCNQSCNKSCVLGLCCTAGQSNCSGVCADTKTDLAHCGGCGIPCSGTCTNGTCCAATQTYCSGTCVDTQTSAANCGGCGKSCAGTCTSGVCCTASTACSPTSPCFNLGNDAKNCGACGHSCLEGSCSNGVCQPFVIAATPASTYVYSLAIDDQNVYWNENSGSTTALKTCPKSGCTGPARVLSTFAGVGVNMHYDAASKILFVARGSNLLVDGYDTSGTRVFQVATTTGMAWGLTSDANYVYFSDGNNIVRSTKDGASQTVIASALVLPVQSLSVDSSANMIYAVLNGDASLIRTPTTGSAPDVWTNFGPGVQKVGSYLAVANGSVYWSNSGTAPDRIDGGVYMCPTSGCTQATALFTGHYGDAIAVDASSLYFGAGGTIYRCAATGGCGGGPVKVLPPNDIVSFSGETLKMDSTAIYYATVFGPISKLAR